MKISRILAASTGIAIAGALVATALPASANPGDVYITADQVGVEGDSYPAQWFKGEDDAPATKVSDAYGLTLTGDFQLLNGANLGTGKTIPELVSSASVIVSQGFAAFQIPIFAHPGATQVGFTTLRPNTFNEPGVTAVPGVDTLWTTSQRIYAADGVTVVYERETSDTLTNLLAAVGTEYQILASGVYTNESTGTNSITAITWNGVTTRFTPGTTATVDPATITPAELADPEQGVGARFTGFIPGESVIITIDGEQVGEPGIANEDGIVGTTLYTTGGAADPGTYTTAATGELSGESVSTTFVVSAPAAVTPGATAPAAAVRPAELAETGVEANMGLLTAGVLVLAGLTMVLVRRRVAAIAKD